MGNFSDSLLIINDKDGKRLFLRRCNSNLYSIKEYRHCINNEIKLGKELNHRNLPHYEGLHSDESGEYVAFSYSTAIPLYKALLETSFNINNKKESSYIVNQIIDAVAYMHENGTLHLNINPATVYVRKGNHIVTLFNPLSSYICKDISYCTFSGIYSDPALFNENNVPNEKNDIYSIGKIIEYIYSYSNVTPWIRHIINKATNADQSKRYANIHELRKDFKRTNIADIASIAIKVFAILALLFIGYIALKDEAERKENYEFREETNRRHKTEQKAREQVSAITTTEIDTISSLKNLPKDEVEKIFKDEFKKDAVKAINAIYTKEMLNATPEKFQQVSLKQFSKLDMIQKKLAVKYNLNFSYTTKLSKEVIDEVTQIRLKELKKK